MPHPKILHAHSTKHQLFVLSPLFCPNYGPISELGTDIRMLSGKTLSIFRENHNRISGLVPKPLCSNHL